MNIISPRQALCADRQQLSNGLDPGRWVNHAVPPGWSLHSFHFFVNWAKRPPLLGDQLWMTRLVSLALGEPLGSVTIVEVEHALRSGAAWQELNALGHFSAAYGHQTTAVLLPEIPVVNVDDNTPYWIAPYNANGRCAVTARTLASLKVEIQQESGGPVRIGSKGLTYGTSAIECALSKTDSAYPGDVDAVIVNQRGIVRCVVEYKKHTLSSDIGENLIDRYYPKPDGRKYQRLNALVSCYRVKEPGVLFAVLYYSTQRPEIRIQVIDKVLPNTLMIARDSDDLSIAGMSDDEVGRLISQWL